ncbi:TRAP transporter substrate-binding protein [Hyphobacterium sp. CCMP332]|nr:TRAP transporter substrate-binding protein [Hyphobacterium sp. CCMP332]
MERRKFIRNISGLTLAAGLGISCSEVSRDKIKSVNINYNKKYYWKLLTTWPPNFPILGEGCQLFADWVNEMSGGRMEIRIFGGGEIVPALEVFDAVSNGIAEIGNGSPYYWSGKIPAAQIFAAVPFGMNTQQFNAWISQSEGAELWEELYKPFNLIPVLSGNTGMQMGGWFNKELNAVDDLAGLKMRIPGLGGKVFSNSGGTSVLVAGGEIFTNLERGVIDATEWIGPYHDYLMGFHKIAKYYYYPGWHETATSFETILNSEKYNSLPTDLKAIIKHGLGKLNNWVLSAFDMRNAEHLKKIKEEGKVLIRPFPDIVIEHLRKNTAIVLDELSTENNDFKRIYNSYYSFKKHISEWTNISEKAYFERIYN